MIEFNLNGVLVWIGIAVLLTVLLGSLLLMVYV